jgi:hypothetical protein
MPAPGWNDTFEEGLIWQAGAFLAMFEQAIWERQQAVASPPPVLPTFTQIDTLPARVVQGLVRKWQEAIAYFEGPGYGGYHFSAGGLCQRFVLPGVDIESTAPADWSAAYLNDWLCWQPDTLLNAVNGHAEGWTRKYERRIATLGSAAYTDGQALAEGHLVRCLADGRIYLRLGGSWIVSDVTTADTVTAYGNMQAGDYIGHWCFAELRDALNLLTRSYHLAGLTGKKSHLVYGPGYTNSQTMAGARGLAEGLWPGEFTSSYPISAWKRTFRWEDGGEEAWWAEIGRDTSKVQFTLNPIVAVDCGVWLYFRRCTTGHGPAMETFDNQGDHDAAEESYRLWQTVSPMDVTPYVTGQFSDESAMPPHWGPSPPSEGNAAEMLAGYRASDPLVIANWQFTQTAGAG